MEQIIEKNQVIFNKILKIEAPAKLLILFDAFGYDIADYCAEVATNMGIPFCARFIPMSTQLIYVKNGKIDIEFIKCVENADALIFAVSDHEGCTKFRANVLDKAVNTCAKILHLPGVDIELFVKELTTINVDILRQYVNELGPLFHNAKEIEILTSEKHPDCQKDHRLLLQLDTNRKIHFDIGSPESGEIAQLPPGEIYVAPVEYKAEGSIVINGSAPERVFHNKDLVVLKITHGFVDIENSFFGDTIECLGFKQELIQFRNLDKGSIILGEFGIGLNPTITSLTGKPIHDEKVLGTAHIALGSNTPFGGQIDCESHIDLIFIPTSIEINGKNIRHKWGITKNLKKDATYG
jgi:hypothetical protein